MKKGTIWLIASCLMIATVIITSCGQTATPPTTPVTQPPVTTPVTSIPTPGATPAPSATPSSEKPVYGGMLNLATAGDPVYWDPYWEAAASWINFGHEHLVIGDISLPESTWSFNGQYIPMKYRTGAIAEKWEQTDPVTVTFWLRKGIRFNAGLSAAKTLLNNREVTADDVVWSFNRLCGLGPFKEKGHAAVEFSLLKYVDNVKALDKYTVQFHFSAPHTESMWMLANRSSQLIYPHEIVEKYGDYNNWQNYCGTGPFIVTDYIRSGSVTLTKNPDYWQTSPQYGKEYKLPFIDGINMLIIPDLSTRISALRTGKLDMLPSLNWDQIPSLTKSNPDLKVRPTIYLTQNFAWRTNVKPFTDVRVRQALTMAIDKQAIVKDYFKGAAFVSVFPFVPSWKDQIVPFDQLPDKPLYGSPASIKELYNFTPDSITRAKQILADAGYPNGFKTEVIVANTQAVLPDELQVVKDMWSKINVELEIKIMDNASYTRIANTTKTFPQMAAEGGGHASPFYMMGWYNNAEGDYSVYNAACVYDPEYNKRFQKLITTFDAAEQNKLSKEAYLYFVEKAYQIDLPSPYMYNTWQPWLKGAYWGQSEMTFGGGMYHHMWLDRELKKSLGK